MTFKTTVSLLSFTTAALLAAEAPAHAGGLETCSFAKLDASNKPTYDVQKVTYWSTTAPTQPFSPRCDWFPSVKCNLSGWMISTKNAPGNQKAIIFLHGSEGGVDNYHTPVPDEQSLTVYSCPIQRFVDEGYVVFMPFRRGVDDVTNPSTLPYAARGLEGWSNTGLPANASAIDYIQSGGYAETTDNYTAAYINVIDDEVTELAYAIRKIDNYIRPDMTTRLVDPSRVAIVGHSFGGAMSTLASSNDVLYDDTIVTHGPKAFVSLSGAAMSYHSSHWWHDTLTARAANNNAPLTFTRVLNEDAHSPNDFDSALEPYAATGHFTAKSGAGVWWGIPLSCSSGTDPWQCAHTQFVTNSIQIDKWFPFVVSQLGLVGM